MSLNEQLVHHSLIRDGTAFRNTSFEPKIHEPAVCQQLQPSQPDKDVNISEMIKKWTLNTEQARAFKIVAEHSLIQSQNGLQMYLGGPGGTGKSRVINTLQDYFKQ